MKTTEYIKAQLGLISYSDKDVFKGYNIYNFDGVSYLSKQEQKKIFDNAEKIRVRVLTRCKKEEVMTC